MKKLNLLIPSVIILVILIFSGCDKLKDALDFSFTTDETEITFTVNPNPAGDYTLSETILQSDLNQQIEDNGGDIDNINSVKINECVFEVVSPERNFNEFKSVELELNATKVAWKDNIPENSISEELIISHDDLTGIVHEDTYTVVIKGTLDQELTTAIIIKAKIKYSVNVGLL